MRTEYTNIPINKIGYKPFERKKSRKSSAAVILIAVASVLASIRLISAPYGSLEDIAYQNASAVFAYQKTVDFLSKSEASVASEAADISLLPQEAVSAMSHQNADFAIPLIGKITSPYATREDPFGSGELDYHRGIDISAAEDIDIKAYRAGTVKSATYNDSYGNYIILSHDEGMETVYAHCEKLYVSKGDSVEMGQIIAMAGSTGRSTAAHLHFEVRIDGKTQNPEDYLA